MRVDEESVLTKIVFPSELNAENWKLLPTTTTIITTIDENGTPNAAPYGWVIGISVDPWLIAFASDLGHKTWKNTLATHEFVVNLPGEEILKQLLVTSKGYPKGTDKLKISGLTPVPSERVKPPRIKECKLHLECAVEFTKEFGDGGLVVGKVLAASLELAAVDGDLKKGFTLNPESLKLLTYWGSNAKGEHVFTTATKTLKARA